MPLDTKRLADLTQDDILELITNGVEEGRGIDYKQALKIGTDGEKKEFLFDVCSFGNASGGHLVFGVAEKEGKPTATTPLTVADCDAERLRIESLVGDGISPRLAIELAFIPVTPRGYVLVMRIARSWLGPHMVSLQRTGKFYSRNSAGKYQLDVGELRSAFTSGAQVGESIREFRQGRLSAIVSGETPICFPEGPKIILHFCPYASTLLGAAVDIRAAYKQNQLIRTMLPADVSRLRFNFDGVMACSQKAQVGQGYLQLFRDGKVECVETRLFQINRDKQAILSSTSIEAACIGCTRRMFDLFAVLGAEPLCAVMLTLIGVKGYTLVTDAMRFDQTPIDRDTLIIAPEIAEAYDSASVATFMRPMFDALWNATGLSQCGDYDASGQPNQELEEAMRRMR
jgi:hypothetical protein